MQTTSSKSSFHWPSLLQASLTGVAALLAFGLTGLLLIGVAPQLFGSGFSPVVAASSTLMAAGVAFAGVLTLPSIGFAVMRLMGKPIPDFGRPLGLPVRTWVIGLSIVALPSLWAVGAAIASIDALSRAAWLLLPVLHVFVIGIPVLLMIQLGRGGLPGGSPQRAWGAFTSGLIIAPAAIIILEILVAAVMIVAAIIYLATQPELLEQLQRFSFDYRYGAISPEEALDRVMPYLVKPAVAFSGLLYIAVFVPLIEEVLKPIGVWLLIGRKLTPIEGFAAGALSGAGYALVENLGASANLEGWAALVVVRAGTAALHIYTAGLMGWALASAWGQRRYIRLGVAYLLAVTIHGLWNALSIFGGVVTLPLADQYLPPAVTSRGLPALGGVVVLAIAIFVLLIWSNFALRRSLRLEGIDDLSSGGLSTTASITDIASFGSPEEPLAGATLPVETESTAPETSADAEPPVSTGDDAAAQGGA